MAGFDAVAAEPVADEQRLWHYGLQWVGRAINLQVPHRPLDERKMIWLLQDMYAVGERPAYDEFKRYVDRLWPHAPSARKMARDLWRTILRNPHHRFRRIRGWREWPLYGADVVIERSGIGPDLEDRVDMVLHVAADDFLAVAFLNPSSESFRRAQLDLEAAVRGVRDARRLRFGKSACGEWFFEDDQYAGGPVRPRD